MILSLVPYAGWLLSLIGFIMVLVAVKYISDALGDRSIFNNMIIAVAAGITGVIIGGVFIAASVLSFINFPWQGEPQIVPSDIFSFLLAIISGLAIMWVAEIISAIFLKRSFDTISRRLGVGMFGTAALLYLIGALTTIILVGLIIILVAEILLIVAFFSIPEQTPQITPLPPQPP